MKHLFTFVLLSLAAIGFITNPAKAQQNYDIGTTGYLYENCKSAIAKDDPEALINSFCFAFFESFFIGALTANWIIMPVYQGEQCKEEMADAYDHITNRFCPALSRDEKKLYEKDNEYFLNKDGNIYTYLIAIFLHAAEFFKEQEGADALNVPVIEQANRFFTDDGLCKNVNENPAQDIIAPKLPDSYKDYEWPIPYGAKEVKPHRTYKDIYQQCKADIAQAAGSSHAFKQTLCSGDILGYMSGAFTTIHLQDREPIQGACKEEVDDLYYGLNITKRQCVNYDTDPLHVAELFINEYERQIKTVKGDISEYENLEGQGQVGYKVIYGGLLCKE